MTCYVDDMRAQLGRMKMCHMIADSHVELCAMALRIGVAQRWIQHTGTYKEHFDLSLNRRERAIGAGAIAITRRELVERCVARRSIEELAASQHAEQLHRAHVRLEQPDPPAARGDEDREAI